MKSIVEEASSIVKAIEKGWIRAGKPQEFSVKVFEEPQRNFFGLTVKSAKIALFFKHDEPTHSKKQSLPKEHKESPKEKNVSAAPAQHKPQPHPAQPQKPKQEKVAPQQKPVVERLVWNDDLIKAAKAWTSECLSLLGLSHISFSINPTGNLLRLEFDAPLTQERDKERYLFKSFAHLILEHLSQQFKKNVKSLKITISTLQSPPHDSL